MDQGFLGDFALYNTMAILCLGLWKPATDVCVLTNYAKRNTQPSILSSVGPVAAIIVLGENCRKEDAFALLPPFAG